MHFCEFPHISEDCPVSFSVVNDTMCYQSGSHFLCLLAVKEFRPLMPCLTKATLISSFPYSSGLLSKHSSSVFNELAYSPAFQDGHIFILVDFIADLLPD